jgi:hypothetical protein
MQGTNTTPPTNKALLPQSPGKTFPKALWYIMPILFIFVIIFGMGVFFYITNVQGTKNSNEVPYIISYLSAVTNENISQDNITIDRWKRTGSDYIEMEFKIRDKRHIVKYKTNPVTNRIEEIDVILFASEDKSLDNYKRDLADGEFNNFGYLINPENWINYNDNNYPTNKISEIVWITTEGTKEVRGVYIDNLATRNYLFACRLFKGSAAYEQNTCMVR